MTLVELLIVIVILTTLVAAAIPLLSPSNDDRRLREAARGLNTYITGAQARAASTHRPFGIAIKRLSSDTNTDKNKLSDPNYNFHDDNGVSLEVFYVEQLPPYTGFDANSRASVAITNGGVLVRFVTRGSNYAQGQDRLPIGWDPDLFPPATIHPGDVIEINGTQFRLLRPSSTNLTVSQTTGCFEKNPPIDSNAAIIFAQPVNNSGQQINPKYDDNGFELPRTPTSSPYWTSAAPYKILRQPTSTSDEPYQLPEGAAIDLRASSVGLDNSFYWPYDKNNSSEPRMSDNDQGVVIMFTPEGRVARVAFYHSYPPLIPTNLSQEWPPFDGPVVDNIYLLVGRRDRIAAPDVGSDSTLQSSAILAATTDEARAKLREPINWLNGSSRWVVIGAQTGRVATIENATVDLKSWIEKYTQSPYSFGEKTESLRASQIVAAREFTREMGQLGGR